MSTNTEKMKNSNHIKRHARLRGAVLSLTILLGWNVSAATHAITAQTPIPVQNIWGSISPGRDYVKIGASTSKSPFNEHEHEDHDMQNNTAIDVWCTSSKKTVHVTAWQTATGVGDTNNVYCNGTISSKDGKARGAYVWAFLCNSLTCNRNWIGENPQAPWIDVPAIRECAANVSDVNFGKVSAGDTVEGELVIDKSMSTYSSTVTIGGKDMQAGGNVYLGGASDVTVTPGSSYIDLSKGQWISKGDVNNIPLTLRVGTRVPGGPLQSVLTATLTCE